MNIGKKVPVDRRQFLAGAGAGLFVFQLQGVAVLLTPRAARAQQVPLRTISADEAALIDALGDTLVPGAAAAGISHYLDQQLSVDAPESLLMIRYLDVPPPYAEFYRPCIAAVAAASQQLHGRAITALRETERNALVESMQAGKLTDWRAPPAQLFYFVLRADAVDVVYGTPEGFAKLGIPYMAHVTPPTPW